VCKVINLSLKEKEECMEDVRRKCGIMEEHQWQDWRDRCNAPLLRDRKELLPFQRKEGPQRRNQFLKLIQKQSNASTSSTSTSTVAPKPKGQATKKQTQQLTSKPINVNVVAHGNHFRLVSITNSSTALLNSNLFCRRNHNTKLAPMTL
jgi:hypothetical protein